MENFPFNFLIINLGKNDGVHKADNIYILSVISNAKSAIIEINFLYKYFKYVLQKSTNMLMTNLDAFRQ